MPAATSLSAMWCMARARRRLALRSQNSGLSAGSASAASQAPIPTLPMVGVVRVVSPPSALGLKMASRVAILVIPSPDPDGAP